MAAKTCRSGCWALFVSFTVLVIFRQVAGSKILVYPFGHCLNSHLLNAEKFTEIVADSKHSIDLLVSTAYVRYEHHVDTSATKQWLGVSVTTSSEYNATNGSMTNTQRLRSQNTRDLRQSVELIKFNEPQNYRPICEYDTTNFMLDATLGERFKHLFHTLVRYCDNLLQDKALLKRLKATHYDLLIIDSLDPCGRVLADYLDVPFIVLYTIGLGHFDSNPRPPSYLPAAIAPFTSDMNFGQRVANVIMKVMYDFVIPATVGFNAPFEALKNKYGLNTSLSIDRTYDRASLRLVNSDFSVDYPAPIHPDTILVGGFAVDPRPPALAADLEQFVSGSGDAGIIVVSFGTLVRHYNEDLMKFMMEAFARLPQRVIWRSYDSEVHQMLINSNSTVNNRYANIRLVRWLPQSSLLVHPKTRLFISHCGLNSVMEAAYYGVPVLALPLSGDQFHNAAKITGPRVGMGLTNDIRTLSTESLYNSILHILTDDTFYKNAKKTSRILTDQLFSPAERIRYWVDYVIRHKGADHLRSESSHRLNWFQYWSLDVAVFLLSIVMTSLYVILRVLSLVGRTVYNAMINACFKLKID